MDLNQSHPYHIWTLDANGDNVALRDQAETIEGAYAAMRVWGADYPVAVITRPDRGLRLRVADTRDGVEYPGGPYDGAVFVQRGPRKN